mmetsp:Transcript_58051/g.136041  ORF Transcript_58051/g.136041 Transcript_58051/m.136041 type:complete len:412 (-) Transcript_58051:253-1488(-)
MDDCHSAGGSALGRRGPRWQVLFQVLTGSPIWRRRGRHDFALRRLAAFCCSLPAQLSRAVGLSDLLSLPLHLQGLLQSLGCEGRASTLVSSGRGRSRGAQCLGPRGRLAGAPLLRLRVAFFYFRGRCLLFLLEDISVAVLLALATEQGWQLQGSPVTPHLHTLTVRLGWGEHVLSGLFAVKPCRQNLSRCCRTDQIPRLHGARRSLTAPDEVLQPVVRRDGVARARQRSSQSFYQLKVLLHVVGAAVSQLPRACPDDIRVVASPKRAALLHIVLHPLMRSAGLPSPEQGHHHLPKRVAMRPVACPLQKLHEVTLRPHDVIGPCGSLDHHVIARAIRPQRTELWMKSTLLRLLKPLVRLRQVSLANKGLEQHVQRLNLRRVTLLVVQVVHPPLGLFCPPQVGTEADHAIAEL